MFAGLHCWCLITHPKYKSIEHYTVCVCDVILTQCVARCVWLFIIEVLCNLIIHHVQDQLTLRCCVLETISAKVHQKCSSGMHKWNFEGYQKNWGEVPNVFHFILRKVHAYKQGLVFLPFRYFEYSYLLHKKESSDVRIYSYLLHKKESFWCADLQLLASQKGVFRSCA